MVDWTKELRTLLREDKTARHERSVVIGKNGTNKYFVVVVTL